MVFDKGFFVKIKPVRKRRVAKVRDLSIEERIWGIERSSGKDALNLRIQREDLLPPHEVSDYITLQVAYEQSGIPIRFLRKIAREEIVEAIKVQGRWLIVQNSLNQYIRNSKVVNFDRYFTTSKASISTGLSTNELTKLAREKVIRGIKVQGRWLLEKESLNKYLLESKKSPQNEGYISTRDASESYGLSTSTLSAYARNKKIRAKKLRGKWWLQLKSLENLLANK